MVTKTRPLTQKQTKFVKAKAEGKTGVEAALIAYDTTDYNTAGTIAVENLQKPTIKQALDYEMAKQGITMEAIIRPVKEALTAEKVSFGGSGEEAIAGTSPDHSARLQAVKIAAQFMGIGKNTEVSGGVHFHNHVEDKRNEYSE